ncbi:hypothetical protein [Nitrincola iocasae]|jgi:hypothetical protein|uniref:hypothetical protein n=1 Tax=Nitrincola iocasae TaxID=2614693 RepID=UPI00177B55CA|nr:hypothetical protein [Nitrincola iocasae]
MWRWLMVMLFLVNALVFFWYAQQYSGLASPSVPPLPSQNALQLVDDAPEAGQASPVL